MRDDLGLTATQCCGVERTPLIERLRNQKLSLERQLADLNEALQALDSNPEIAKVLTLVSKISNY